MSDSITDKEPCNAPSCVNVQLPGRGSLEFNPLRLSLVRRWLLDHQATHTSELKLQDERNANAAVHDDATCRPTFDVHLNRWVQRCISCAHLGTNRQNTQMALAIRRKRMEMMDGMLRAGMVCWLLGVFTYCCACMRMPAHDSRVSSLVANCESDRVVAMTPPLCTTTKMRVASGCKHCKRCHVLCV